MKRQNQGAFDQVVPMLGDGLRLPLGAVVDNVKQAVFEIRLRAGCPIMLTVLRGSLFVKQSGETCSLPQEGLLICRREDLEIAFRSLCGYSVHTHQHEIKNGYVSLRGGHRAGICGTAVIENGQVVSIRDISSINLRIARQIYGAADGLIPYFSPRPSGMLIVGPPSSGKTTVLRDLARQLSLGEAGRCWRTLILDERGELAAVHSGQPQNDIGLCCDVMDGIPKAKGMIMALRSMSPQVIVCDEIGDENEAKALLYCINGGVSVVASAHAGSIDELICRPQIEMLLKAGAFKRIVLLRGGDTVCEIEDVLEADDWHAKIFGRDSRCHFVGTGGHGINKGA